MNTKSLIKKLEHDGITLHVEGNDLVLDIPKCSYDKNLLSSVKEHKAEIIDFFTNKPEYMKEDEREQFEERAAIMQHDAHMPRKIAEKHAYSNVIEFRRKDDGKIT